MNGALEFAYKVANDYIDIIKNDLDFMKSHPNSRRSYRTEFYCWQDAIERLIDRLYDFNTPDGEIQVFESRYDYEIDTLWKVMLEIEGE